MTAQPPGDTNPTEQARELVAQFRQVMKGFDVYLEQSPNPGALKNHIAAALKLNAEIHAQAARDEERERWQELEASVCPEDVGFVEYIQALRAQAPRPELSLPGGKDCAESVPPGKPDPSEYARGVRAAADLCESEAVRNREAERNVPALTYRVAARQILALLPKREGAE